MSAEIQPVEDRFENRLKDFRVGTGTTLRRMAEVLGVHVSLISQIENGRRSLTQKRAEQAAAFFGAPVSEILYPVGEDGMPLHELHAEIEGVLDLAAFQKREAEAEYKARMAELENPKPKIQAWPTRDPLPNEEEFEEEFEDDDAFDDTDLAVKPFEPSIPDPELVAIFDDVVDEHSDSAPVSLTAIAKRLGVRVVKADFNGQVSGSVSLEDGRWTIRVNRQNGLARQRFTIAHELAHLKLHQHIIGESHEDVAMFRAPTGDYHIEREADELAADILMPCDLIREEFERNPNATPKQMAQKFGVSAQAMMIRLRSYDSPEW